MSASTANRKSRPIVPGAVTISIEAGLAQVEPGCIDVLGPLLVYEDIAFHKANGHLRHERQNKLAYKLMPDDRLLIPAGCVRRVQRELERLGHAVTVRDFRRLTGGFLHHGNESIGEAEKAFPGLAKAIGNNTQGTIEAPRGLKRDSLIGQIAELLPERRIFIACSSWDNVKRVGAALGHFVGGNVDTVRGWKWRSACRVVCGTYAALDRSQPSDWPVLIFEDAVEAMGRATIEARSEYDQNGIYALVAPQHARLPADQLKLEVLAGPVIYSVPGGRKRPQVTVRLAIYPAPASQLPAKPQERKQQLWRLSQRDRAIADVAVALADRDHAVLWRHGLFLDEGNFSTDPKNPAVVVVVESVDHAENLARLMPDWHVFHACTATNGGDIVNNLWGVPPRSIVTMVYANELQHLSADAVVVAASGAHPQLPLALGKRRAPLTIIDFADAFDATAEAETWARLTAYRELGFDVRAKAPEPAAIDTDKQQPRRSSQRRTPYTSRRHRRSHRH